MDTNSTQTLRELPFPTRLFWRALLLIHHYYLVEELGTFKPCHVPAQVVEAVRLLDCYIEEGWCEDEEWWA